MTWPTPGATKRLASGSCRWSRTDCSSGTQWIAVAGGDEDGQTSLQQLVRPGMLLHEDVVTDGHQQPSPGALALDRVVPPCQAGGPPGIGPFQPLRVHEPASDAVARLRLDPHGSHHSGQGTLGIPAGEGQGRPSAHGQARDVEALQVERVGEGHQVGQQHAVVPALPRVPAGPGMAACVGQVEPEVLSQEWSLRGPVLGRGRRRRVKQHERGPLALHDVGDAQAVGVELRHGQGCLPRGGREHDVGRP